MKAFFVTGTDTGVGKTTVACALIAAARARGLRALGMKPVETGCAAGPDGVPRALDAIALERAARADIGDADAGRPRDAQPPAPGLERDDRAEGLDADAARPRDAHPWTPGLERDDRAVVGHAASRPRDAHPRIPAPERDDREEAGAADTKRQRDALPRTPGEPTTAGYRPDGAPRQHGQPTAAGNRTAPEAAHYNIYRFAAPLAPSVAGELEGAEVALAPILRAVDRLRSLAPDLLLIEGAGGLLVPLTSSTDMADLAAALGLPLIIVARDGLGTINHTLLTLEAAASRGLEVAAVILSAATPGTSERDAARNAEEIARRGRVPVIGRLPFLGAPRAAASTAIARPAHAPDAQAHASRSRAGQPGAGAAQLTSRDTLPNHADPSPPGLSRADHSLATTRPEQSARTDSVLADATRESSTPDSAAPPTSSESLARTDRTRASSTREDQGAPGQSSRTHSALADATRESSTPDSAAPPTSPESLARADRTRPSSTREDEDSIRQPEARADGEPAAPALAELAAAAEAHLDLAFLLPDAGR